MMPSRGYLLCCIERTGSNVLAKALHGTNLAGRPLEYFNPVEQDKQWIRDIIGGYTLIDGLSKILAAGTTPNGVFGAKVHWGHFRHLGMRLTGEWDDSKRRLLLDLLRSRPLLPPAQAHELLRSQFPDVRPLSRAYTALQSHLSDLRIVWLKRRNMIARAISDFRARKTGVWYQALSNGRGAAGIAQAGDFDFGEIHRLYCLGGFQEGVWGRFFQEHRIKPHELTYEDLVAEYEATVRGVLEFLQIERTVAVPPIESVRQADDQSSEWEERYGRMSADAGLL